MPRGARLAFANSFYHVFNRGINKHTIFRSLGDYRFFISKLYKLKEKYDHSIYAYCLMPNHFHISIQTRNTPISTIMSSLTTSYSMYFNNHYRHLGPVFQNRFKSILIENDTYFLQLSRYIYLNPVKARLISNPFLYEFSSIREAIGMEPLYILDTDVVRLIGENKTSRSEYTKFIYEGLEADYSDIEELFGKEESVLGTNRFITSVKKSYRKSKNG